MSFETVEIEQALIRGIVGSPRAVQHALRVMKIRAEALACGEVVPRIDVNEFLDRAYKAWREAGGSSWLTADNANAVAAEEAFLCTCYPSAWSATPAMVDDIHVAEMLTRDVPVEWLAAAQADALRLRVVYEITTVLPPFPFQERYIRSLGMRRLCMTDCISLVQSVRTMALASGAMGRGKAFELAVALELCLPTSALLRAILECSALAHLTPTPISTEVLPVQHH